ncbi:MAG: hypothetical protein FJ284_14080, partial [Planctomycetes bacterium]|nr:hypothetical protein [Planctomycetota bacterium]
FRKVEGRAAVDPGPVEAGLAYDYFEGENWTRLPDCDQLPPLRSGTVPRFVVPPHRGDGFTVRYRGFIRVPEDGIYRFFLRSDDGSDLAVAGEIVVANDGVHDARGEATGTMALAAGLHPLELRFFDAACQEVLQVSFAGPGFGKREIPAEALCRSAGAAAAPPADPGLVAVETALEPLCRSFMLQDPERAEAALEQARADLRRIVADHPGREPTALALRALAIYAAGDDERAEATAALAKAFPDHPAVAELRAVDEVMAILVTTAEVADEAAAVKAWKAALPKLQKVLEANPENEAGKRVLVCLFMRADEEILQQEYGLRLEKHFLADPLVRLIVGQDCEEGECPDGLGVEPLFELPADGGRPAAEAP